jgi:hypothetical protein
MHHSLFENFSYSLLPLLRTQMISIKACRFSKLNNDLPRKSGAYCLHLITDLIFFCLVMNGWYCSCANIIICFSLLFVYAITKHPKDNSYIIV